MDTVIIERRLYKRYDVPIRISYRLAKGVIGTAITKNISMEGIRFQLPDMSDVDAGMKLYIEIQIPKRNRTTIILGRIIWMKKFETTMNNNYDVGIKFVHVDPYDIEDIINKAKIDAER